MSIDFDILISNLTLKQFLLVFHCFPTFIIFQEVKEKDEAAKEMQEVSRSLLPRCYKFRAKDSTWT